MKPSADSTPRTSRRTHRSAIHRVAGTAPVAALLLTGAPIAATAAAAAEAAPEAVGAAAAAPAPRVNVPPPPTAAERIVVIDELHGERIEDPYRWLEGGLLISDPDARAAVDARVAAWTDIENAYTRAVLDSIPGREVLRQRVAELMQIDSIGMPSTHKNRYFNFVRTGSQNHAVLYVREGLEGEPRVVFDPNALDETGLTSLSWHAPSQDGRLMAFGLDRAGAELPTLYVLNVDTGEWLADEIPNRAGSVNWLPDNSGFIYEALRDVTDPYSNEIRFHRLGTHPRQDPVLVRQQDQDWGPFAWLSRDARWMLVGDWTGTNSNDLWVVDADHWQRSGEFVQTPIAIGHEGRFTGPVNGDTLYMQTSWEAPNGAIFAVDLNRPQQDNWNLIIPERDDMVIEGVSLARGMLVVQYLHRAQTRIERFDLSGRSLGAVDLPGIGSASISTDDDRTDAFVTFTSFNEPTSIYHVDLLTNERTLWARPEVPVDPSLVEVRQVTYKSKDGTPITMFVVHRKGIRLDGNNPVLLNGYGGFNVPMTPWFSRTMFPWFEAGGVFALPNLRGGGEYGDAWHRAGMLENKQNVFDDFIAAAEWLIDNGYTNPQRLAITGGSNGGLLTGAVLVQRPDLFKAVVTSVPLLDMLRYHLFLMARYWIPEYGDPENAEQVGFIRAYSPYHNVREGVAYPSVFVTAGENDARVHPMHARKFMAALRHATGSDPQEAPILLWVDRDAGHGSGKPMSNLIRDVVDERIYLMWQLGMLDALTGDRN